MFVASSGCGGSGGGAEQPQTDDGNKTGWIQGQFLPAETFSAHCAVPRPDTDAATGQRIYPDVPGSVVDENNWLRSWTNDSYLWYAEILDQDPVLFSDPRAYFDELRTTALTSSGRQKDRFHFTLDTEEWIAQSQSGISAGYGLELVIRSAVPPRDVVVSFTHPDTPATAAAISRGARIVSVDGEDLISGNTQAIVEVINAGLFPAEVGQTHEFDIVDAGSDVARRVALTSAEVVSAPVQAVSTVISPQGAAVGYLHFSEHIATAEAGLSDAISLLGSANIEDLIIDVRYNGGGFLAIAAQLAYMIAGTAQTAGRTFEVLQFNDKYPTTNPVTGTSPDPLPFLDTTIGFSNAPSGQPLPTLDLSRVFVITSSKTCSASESIINSLRGVGVEVIQIGERTCGKPYGFYPTDNCGTTYFNIQFRGVNDAGFGDYADGFSPTAEVPQSETELPGCTVADDFDYSLGDADEARLAAALQYRDTGTCPLNAAPAAILDSALQALPLPEDRQLAIGKDESYWRNNRILSAP